MVKYNSIDIVREKAYDFYTKFMELNGYNDRGLDIFCRELLNSVIPNVGSVGFSAWERHFVRYMELLLSADYMRLAKDSHRVFSTRRSEGLILPLSWAGLCCSLVYGLSTVKFCELGVCKRTVNLFVAGLGERVDDVIIEGELYYIPKEYMVVIKYLSRKGYIATLWEQEKLLKLLVRSDYES